MGKYGKYVEKRLRRVLMSLGDLLATNGMLKEYFFDS